jgi:uncharacterized membrane protein YkvA (DUF1232 family)
MCVWAIKKIGTNFDNIPSNHLTIKLKTMQHAQIITPKIGGGQQANPNFVFTLWRNFKALLRLIKATIDGRYKQISAKTILLCAAAALYFVSPIDIIPDVFIPIGFLDDIAVLGILIKTLRTDIEKFVAWESTQINA